MTNEQITVSRELLRQVVDFCEIEPNNEKAMAAYDSIRTVLEHPQDFQSTVTKRPVEADYASHVAYTRALEAYCDGLEQPAVEPVAVVDANDDGYWADILPDRDVKVGQLLYTAPQAQEKS